MGLPSAGRSRAQRTAAAPGVEGRDLSKGPLPCEWSGCFKQRQVWPEALDAEGAARRLCRELAKKVEIREINQSSFMACQSFYFKGHVSGREGFE